MYIAKKEKAVKLYRIVNLTLQKRHKEYNVFSIQERSNF